MSKTTKTYQLIKTKNLSDKLGYVTYVCGNGIGSKTIHYSEFEIFNMETLQFTFAALCYPYIRVLVCDDYKRRKIPKRVIMAREKVDGEWEEATNTLFLQIFAKQLMLDYVEDYLSNLFPKSGWHIKDILKSENQFAQLWKHCLALLEVKEQLPPLKRSRDEQDQEKHNIIDNDEKNKGPEPKRARTISNQEVVAEYAQRQITFSRNFDNKHSTQILQEQLKRFCKRESLPFRYNDKDVRPFSKDLNDLLNEKFGSQLPNGKKFRCTSNGKSIFRFINVEMIPEETKEQQQ